MIAITRRHMLASSGAALLLARTSATDAATQGFSWDMLVARAANLAHGPYIDTPHHPAAKAIGYDALNKANFREECTIWGEHKDATALRLFPLHGGAAQPVIINLVENGRVRTLAWDPDLFDMPIDSPVAGLGRSGAYSGFRFMTPTRDADWLVFMGASYFRASGAQKQYGLSARAITIDTAGGTEEFPRFTEFWIERTAEGGTTVYALLDGPSIAGAYRFRNRLDVDGVHQDIDAALFPRRPIAELGLMPMTSMFWFDQAHRDRIADWRPEVHDSDGLLICSTSGAAHFRPLVNPPAPRTDGFAEIDPKGFGLLQRDRNFDHYQDDGVFYDRRPSLFATPVAPLGQGQVRLYTFATNSEYVDNVVAYWTPEISAAAGRPLKFSYRLDWQADAPASGGTPLARVDTLWRGTRDAGRGVGSRPVTRLVVDFAGIDLPVGQATAWVELKGGTLVKSAAYPVVGRHHIWRAVLDIVATSDAPVDIRAQLRQGAVPLSEFLHYPLYA